MKHLHELSKSDFADISEKIAAEFGEFMRNTVAKHKVCEDCLHNFIYTMCEGYLEEAVKAIEAGDNNVRH